MGRGSRRPPATALPGSRLARIPGLRSRRTQPQRSPSRHSAHRAAARRAVQASLRRLRGPERPPSPLRRRPLRTPTRSPRRASAEPPRSGSRREDRSAPISSSANGLVLYHGPSLLDRGPIVAVLTGLWRPSANRKTGAMLQTWILRADESPTDAHRSGADASICGPCPLRGSSGGANRRCYVNLGRAPLAVHRTVHSGLYPKSGTAPRSHAPAAAG
jgi:hypothetical protein